MYSHPQYMRPPYGVVILSVLSLLMGLFSLGYGYYIGVNPPPGSGGDIISKASVPAMGFLLVILGLGLILSGYGLYKGREWARIVTLVIYAVGIGVGILLLGGGFGKIGFTYILLGVAIIVYLNSPDAMQYFEYIKRVGTISKPRPQYVSPPPSQKTTEAVTQQPRVISPPPSQQPKVISPPPKVSREPTISPGKSSGAPTSHETIAPMGVSPGPSYTLEMPGGSKIRIVNQAERVFSREDFSGYLPEPQLMAISRRVSGGHFKITASFSPEIGWKYYIEDLGSKNGTFLNGSDIRGRGKVEVKHGDIIGIGGVVNVEFKEV